MPKGYQRQTCAEAVKASLELGEIVTANDLFRRVRSKGSWTDSTIWQHLIQLVVNLLPARHHWPSAKPFLLLHEDGTYELYNPSRHPPIRDK